MRLLNIRPARLPHWVLLLVFASTLISTLMPQTAFAAGESYVWSPTDNAVINVTGGDANPTTLTTVQLNGNSFYGNFQHKSGCQFKVGLQISFDGSGRLSIPTSISSPGSPPPFPNPCSPEISQTYDNQQVQVTGTRAGPGTETEYQKSVGVNLYSSKPSGESPASVVFTFKRTNDQVITTLTVPKTEILGVGQMPEPNDRPVWYPMGNNNNIKLDPGTYKVCFSEILLECQTFTKVIYQPFSKSYGTAYVSPNVNKNIGVKLEIHYTGSAGDGRTVGPVNVELQSSSGQVLRTIASSSFTQESCDPGDLTPSAFCQVQGTPTDSTTNLTANFDNVDPGEYKVCVAGTDVCQNVTKVIAADTSVTLVLDGATGQQVADGTLAEATGNQGDPLCDEQNSGALGWFFCSVGQTLITAVQGLDAWIITQLRINTDDIFNPQNKPESRESSTAFRTAWSIFRNIAYAIFIILGLIMIISQIMGLDIFDAYTIRKMLPKLVAAAIFIPLLWPLLRLVFEMANDSGVAIMQLIEAPFQNVGTDISIEKLFLGTAAVGGIGAAAFFAIGGWGVFLAVMASILLALLSALVILAARDIVAYVLIIASPIAIICATFEPFKKVFTLWKTFLFTILLSIPAIGAVLAASKVAARISIETDPTWGILLAAIFLAAGYALFWKIFQALDKVSGQLGNLVGNVTGKAQKALSDYRGNTLKKRWEAGIEGRRSLGFFGAGNMFTNLGRRARMTDEAGLGAWGVGRRGRAKYKEAVRTMQAGVAAKMLEQDHDRAGGDDDAMMLLRQRGMTESKFIRQYSEMAMRGDPSLSQADATQRARNALGLSQTSLGARVGTSAMQIAAQKALLKSNTSYRRNLAGQEMSYEEMTRTMYQDVGDLVSQGLITAADGGAMIKSNGARLDRSGVGFGTAIAKVDQVSRGQALTTQQIREMSEEVLTGGSAGQLLAQRHETVRMMAPEMLRRVGDAYRADGNAVGPEFIQQIAITAGRRDVMAQIAPLNAGLLAEGLEGQEIAGRTISQWEEELRDNPIFQEYRREYARAAEAEAAGGAGRDPTAGPLAPRGPLGS